jgi:predicted dehydrogenase
VSGSRLTRREILAAAAIAPALWPSHLGRWRRGVSPNLQVAVGVIGIGIRGRNLMNGAFLRQDGFRVVAVCDVDTTRRVDGKRIVDERYANTDCAAYGDHHDLLAHKGLDAVVIATPDHWHANQIIDSARAGMDIYCEKPLTASLREAQVVVEVVRKHNRVFQTGSQQRTEFGKRFVRACEHVRNGHIGKVLNINVGVGDPARPCDLKGEEPEPGLDWDRWQGPVPAREYSSVLSPRGLHGHYPQWRAYQEYAGGGLADMGAHHFDIAHWGLGRDGSGPIRILPPEDPDALRGATVVYEDGVRLTHGGPSGVTFIGESGMLQVDRDRISSVPGEILERALTKDEEHLSRPANHAADWLECIHSRGRPICDVEIGAGSAAICHLLNLAYRHRRPLEWDPTRWRFVAPDRGGEQDLPENAWLDYERRTGYDLQ